MVSREQLRIGGLRAYERGRLLSASRAAWLLVPLVAFCAWETRAGEVCVCLGALLLGASIYLRWRDRRGALSVTTGLVAGGVPLFAGLIAARLVPACADAPLLSVCTAACVALGIPSGFWIGVRTARSGAGLESALAAGGIAGLAAGLGCIGLGVAAVVGAAGGLLLGSASATLAAQRAS